MVSSLGVTLAIVAAFCLAAQALTIRMASRQGRTVDILLVVMLVNIAVLVPLTLLFVPDPVITTRSVLAFAAAGIVGTMLGRIFFYAGIKRVGASRAEPIKASMPLHATIFAFLLLGESVTGLQFMGVLLIVVGIALVSWEGRGTGLAADDDRPWVGLALPLIAAFLFALEPIFATVGLAEGTHALTGLTIKTLAAFTVFAGYLAWQGSIPRLRDLPAGEVRWYVLAGIGSTSFLLAYYGGLTVSRVGIVVPIMQTSPLLVLLASAVFLRGLERVTLRLVLAAGIVVAGAIVVTLAG